ncbi:MAG: glycosyltransferase family 1 protein [Thermoleophilaceae bacterium]
MPQPSSDDERLLADLGLPSRFILYPASLWPHKNHSMLLKALAAVEDDELALVLTGATFGKLDGLMAMAKGCGLGSRVRHLGYVPEDALPALYRRAEALVFPSLHEGFGVPPVEAMASGCPVASSKAAALGEVCGSAAAELDPENPEQMARTIESVVHDEVIRTRLRAAGFRQAARFTWERTAEAHLAAYRCAVELGGG